MVGTKPIKSPQLSLAFFRFASNLIVSFFSVCLFYRIGKDSFKTVEYQTEEFCGKKGERYRIIEHTLLALSNSDTNANWLSPFVCSTNRFVLIFLCHGFFCESFLSCANTYDIYIWEEFVCIYTDILWFVNEYYPIEFVHDLNPVKHFIYSTRMQYACVRYVSKPCKCHFIIYEMLKCKSTSQLISSLFVCWRFFLWNFPVYQKSTFLPHFFFLNTNTFHICFSSTFSRRFHVFVLFNTFALCAECRV